jgi:hypothetical protein
VVEGMLMRSQPIQGKGFLRERGIIYGDVVEGTLVKAQPITGCWGFERGKKEYLSVCLSFIPSFIPSVCPTRINDKIYKLFMSIYPPGGRYVYVFTIQYASSW